jgi:N utilization substance protein B
LQALYEIDVAAHDPTKVIERLLAESDLDPGSAELARQMVAGVRRSLPDLDRVIEQIAPEWPLPDMAIVDRNILRLALWEAGTQTSPLKVAINEAVELAKGFGGEGTRRMVNGALGAFAASSQRLELAGAQPAARGDS